VTAPPEIDAAQADIGLVAALPMELAPFLKRCEKPRQYVADDCTFRGGMYDGIRIVAVETGVGQTRARRGTASLIAAHRPRWIVSCGFAGGLSTTLHHGDIVVPTKMVHPDRPAIELDLHMASDPARRLQVGTLVTVDHVVRTAIDKQRLGKEHFAIAVDMETYAVAAECQAAKQRFMAVRVLTDDAATDLPAEVLSLMGATGAVRMGAIVGALWKRPGSAQDMWRLREVATDAAGRLADFLDGIVRQLHAAR
jgi:adenosylhomocysteine nucleosidase